MAPPKRYMPIHLSRHAVRRWHERVGKDKPDTIKGHMRKAITSAIKRGVLVDKQGAATINVTPDGIKAVVAPSLRGGWEVLTVWVAEEKRRETNGMQVSEMRQECSDNVGVGPVV